MPARTFTVSAAISTSVLFAQSAICTIGICFAIGCFAAIIFADISSITFAIGGTSGADIVVADFAACAVLIFETFDAFKGLGIAELTADTSVAIAATFDTAAILADLTCAAIFVIVAADAAAIFANLTAGTGLGIRAERIDAFELLTDLTCQTRAIIATTCDTTAIQTDLTLFTIWIALAIHTAAIFAELAVSTGFLG
jgi:hypothetical protein